MLELGRALLSVGLLLLIAGALVLGLGRLHLPLGWLPGDLNWQNGRSWSASFPLATCFLISVVLSVLLWIIRHFRP
ncbi:MAG: DUF2905 family protein [Acidobacteriota bacterium]|nr:DUF2905 family protein [Acidobacteriota bacterium]